jgi:serine/threonine protein kinase/WD40 repeat protein
VPDHRLIRVVGRGSYGEVWLAFNIMGTPRAVKIVRRDAFETPAPYEREFAGIRRFEPVSRTSGGLVQVLHVGRDDRAGFFYYVMELADAVNPSTATGAADDFARDYEPRTLRSDMRRSGRLPVADCVEAGLSIAEGLTRLHAAGLVHRDVKPSNIIFVNGRARLADIGLVGEVREGSTLVGTTGYIPPEGPGSPRGDLFALGKVLYEAATGCELARFPATPPEWNGPGHEAEWELHEIVLQLCADTPARRHADAPALQAELGLLRGGQSVRRLRMLERRMKGVRQVAIVGAILFAVIAGALTVARSQERQARENLRRSEEDRFGLLIAQSRAMRYSALPDRRTATLDVLRKAAALRPESTELRDEAAAALMIPELKTVRKWPQPPGGHSRGIFDDRVELFAMAQPDGGVEIVQARDGTVERRLPPPAPGLGLNYVDPFSGDRRWLLARDTSNVMHVLPVAGGPPLTQVRLDPIWMARDFTRDGRWLAVGRNDRSGELIPLGHDAPRRHIPIGLMMDGFVASPDGRWIAAHDSDTNQVALVDLTKDAVVHRILLPPGEQARHVVWSSDSSLLATASDFQTYIWRVDAPDRPVKVLGRHERVMYGVVFSPESAWLLTAARDRQARIWNWSTGTVLAEHRGYGVGIFWSPDGRWIGWRNPELFELLEFTPPTGWTVCHEPPPEVESDSNIGPSAAAFSPDSRWIATASYDAIRIHRVGGGLPILEWKVQGGQSVAWTTNGLGLWAVAGGQRIELGLSESANGLSAMLRASEPLPHPGTVRIDPAGQCWLVSTNRASTGDPGRPWTDVPGALEFPALSVDGQVLAAVDAANLPVWIRRFHETDPPVDADFPAKEEALGIPGELACIPRRSTVVRAYGHGLAAWDLQTGAIRWERLHDEDGTFGNVTATRDGATLAASFGSKEILLVSTADGSVLLRLHPPDLQRVTSLVFDDTGKRLAATCANHVTYLWNLATLRAAVTDLGVRW